jgi:hypothetical protein
MKGMEHLQNKESARYDIGWRNPKTTYLIRSCRENGPNATTKNYDSLETWRKEKTRPSPENLKRWNIYSHEWKRYKNGRMEQSKAMECESREESSDVLKPNIYIHIESVVYLSTPRTMQPRRAIVVFSACRPAEQTTKFSTDFTTSRIITGHFHGFWYFVGLDVSQGEFAIIGRLKI